MILARFIALHCAAGGRASKVTSLMTLISCLCDLRPKPVRSGFAARLMAPASYSPLILRVASDIAVENRVKRVDEQNDYFQYQILKSQKRSEPEYFPKRNDDSGTEELTLVAALPYYRRLADRLSRAR
jgi:hypothetical protein